MLTIQVISYKGSPPQTPLVGIFTGDTGTIGRGDGNTLVLPDPERHISRTHVRVVLVADQYQIENLGAGLPVLINEQQVAPGDQAVLAHADQLQLGLYVMRVAIAAPQGAATIPPAYAAPPPVAPAPARARRAAPPVDDPLALFGGGGGSGGGGPGGANPDPFGDLLAPPPASMPPPPAALIPDDFDPFAPPTQGATPAQRQSFDLGDVPGTPNQSLDEMFGLGDRGGTASPFAPGHPLAEPVHQPNTARSKDPLAALQAGSTPHVKAPALQRDDVPEVKRAIAMPRMVSNEPQRAKPPARPAAKSPPADFRSWEHADDRGEIAGVRKFEAEPAARGARTPAPAQPAHASAPSAAPATDAETDAVRVLLQALLEGAGITDLARPPPLSPELMRIFGQLLRIATEGTLQLLIARAMTKREVHAEATMMASGENNPLKFSPTVEVALQHLLSPHGRGFMSPARALQDAYDDLRSHQFGVMAGMQAALGGVIARFDPRLLEGRLTQKTMLDSLMPMNRKARLWDLFIELYGDISKEAEEDFHTLFGREFVKAYNEQIETLRSAKR